MIGRFVTYRTNKYSSVSTQQKRVNIIVVEIERR